LPRPAVNLSRFLTKFRHNKQVKETEKAEKKRKMLERKRAQLAKKFKVAAETIAIPETNVVVDLPAPKPMNMTEMNIDRNIAKAKKSERDWDKEKVDLLSRSACYLQFRTWTRYTERMKATDVL
jgi:hypothetical protein